MSKIQNIIVDRSPKLWTNLAFVINLTARKMSSGILKEEIVVLFHAALLGRTDVINKVIATFRSEKLSPEEFSNMLSFHRAEDELTPLHVAAEAGHADACRALLV